MRLKVDTWFCCVPLHQSALIIGSVYIVLSWMLVRQPIEYTKGKELRVKFVTVPAVYAILLALTGFLLIIGANQVNTLQ